MVKPVECVVLVVGDDRNVQNLSTQWRHRIEGNASLSAWLKRSGEVALRKLAALTPRQLPAHRW
jgi:hypothetical protein